MLQGTQWQSHGTGDLGTMANHNSTSLLRTLEHENASAWTSSYRPYRRVWLPHKGLQGALEKVRHECWQWWTSKWTSTLFAPL